NGQISSAADMVVAARERERVAGRARERLAGRIGAGTAQLRIRTSNGEIALETVLWRWAGRAKPACPKGGASGVHRSGELQGTVCQLALGRGRDYVPGHRRG